MPFRRLGDLARSLVEKYRERVERRKAERRAEYTAQVLAAFTPVVADADVFVPFFQKLPFILAIPFFYFIGWAYLSDYLRAFNIRISSVDTDINQLFVYAFLSVAKNLSLFVYPAIIFIVIFFIAFLAPLDKYVFSTKPGKFIYALFSLVLWLWLANQSVQAIYMVATANAAAIPTSSACKVVLMLKDDAKSVKDVLPLADDGKSAWVSSIYYSWYCASGWSDKPYLFHDL